MQDLYLYKKTTTKHLVDTNKQAYKPFQNHICTQTSILCSFMTDIAASSLHTHTHNKPLFSSPVTSQSPQADTLPIHTPFQSANNAIFILRAPVSYHLSPFDSTPSPQV